MLHVQILSFDITALKSDGIGSGKAATSDGQQTAMPAVRYQVRPSRAQQADMRFYQAKDESPGTNSFTLYRPKWSISMVVCTSASARLKSALPIDLDYVSIEYFGFTGGLLNEPFLSALPCMLERFATALKGQSINCYSRVPRKGSPLKPRQPRNVPWACP